MSIAIISDITTPETRARGLALVGIAFALGFTVGPPLGAYFTSFDLMELYPSLRSLPINSYSSPALFAFVLILVETAYLAVALPETIHFKSQKSVGASSKSKSKTDAQRKSESGLNKKSAKQQQQERQSNSKSVLKTVSFIHFIYLFIFSGMEFTLTFLVHDRFDFTHAQQGKLLAFIGLLSALIQGGYVRRVAHRTVHERTLVLQGITSCIFGLTLNGVFADQKGKEWVLWCGAAFLAFTSATVVNSLTSLASLAASGGVGASGSRGAVKKRSVDDTRKPNGVHQDTHDDDADANDDQETTEPSTHTPTDPSELELDETGNSSRGHALGKFRSLGQLGRSIGPLFACTGYWVLGSLQCYAAGAAAMVVVLMCVLVMVPKPPKGWREEVARGLAKRKVKRG
ncbi:hypothetical protein HK102_010880 [Quaeritorhiza haematococci]|nr:hypothetical protein HK102_010880 [Quaeritorhiza haematococci]